MSAKRSLKSFPVTFCKTMERSTIDEESGDDNERATQGDNRIKLKTQSFIQLDFVKIK